VEEFLSTKTDPAYKMYNVFLYLASLLNYKEMRNLGEITG